MNTFVKDTDNELIEKYKLGCLLGFYPLNKNELNKMNDWFSRIENELNERNLYGTF